MESYTNLIMAMKLIQNMSKTNIRQILDIMRMKYDRELDMVFITYTLPSLVMQIKIYSIQNNECQEIISEMNILIQKVMPLFDSFFSMNNIDKRQKNAYINFCKTFTSF